MQKIRKGIKTKFRFRTDLFKAAKRAMEFTSSLGSADREKTPVHSTGPYNDRPPITTVIYVHSRPVLSPVATNIGSGLPKGPLWPTGVIAGRGLQFIIITYSAIIETLKSHEMSLFKSRVESLVES